VSNLRAQLRREQRAAGRDPDLLPAVPGVMPDRTQESIDWAMAEAHEVLAFVPHTQVAIAMFSPDEGLAIVDKYFGGADAVAQLSAHLDSIGGSEPTIVIASRLPRQEAST